MFKNYLKTAWRNLVNRKFYSALNIVGLAIGAAVIIAFVTISFQAVKAALANPVKSLRSE
ncbi:hypothetical protein SNE26_10850 [Mucilaginibacter sp. cycad4]|uniref:hypothetical protein n=1 Tax=Mucilaginibacter sp. cycad4 TaxID=3342096 RepID=UPI002AAA633C|nr:hypothetical protein [Mucilaginibacter gossypii]WPV02274.1 hypothetical protein SNE26_10850 [Mucilaginibacter gossypii]